MYCDVCMYRQTFSDAHLYPVNEAAYKGVCLSMEAEIVVCEEHTDWITDEFPETLTPIGGKEVVDAEV